MIGLIGKKIGMTQIFAADNSLVGVTAIQAGPCPILAVKEKNIQLGFDAANEKSLKKAQLGLYKKLNVTPRKVMRDVSREPEAEYKV
ncbi:MAG: 50S ribosomal protein L3, partial [Candidatus Omnitrophica bacterium]|nr:50S ribosomal protein L3 [Candidatus Omnitrophota bacterium]